MDMNRHRDYHFQGNIALSQSINEENVYSNSASENSVYQVHYLAAINRTCRMCGDPVWVCEPG